MALPGFQKYAQDWWHALINNAIFAPAFVILLLVGLKIVEGLNNAFAQGDQNILEAFTQPGGNVGGLLVTFAIAIGFIIGALMTAQQLSIYGSKQVVGAATKAIGTVVGGTVLYPLGMVSNGLSRMYNQAGRVVRRNTPAPLRFAANLLGASALDKVVRTGLKAPGSIALPGGMNSYNTMRTESAARRKEMTEMDRKQAGKGFMDNIGLGENDNDKEKEAREKEAKKVVDAKKFQTDFSSAVAKVRANKDDTDDLEVLVNKMSVSAFKDLPQNINNSAEVEEMAKVMSSSKFKQIMDEKEGVSDKVKKRMKDARYNLLKDQAEKARAGNPDERKKLRQWSTDDLVASGALADDQKRIDLVHTLSDTQFDALVKSNDVPSGMKQKLRDLRDGTGSGARFGDSNSARIAIEGMDTPEIMKIKASTLVDRNVIEHIPPTALAEISKANKSFNPAERQALVSHVTQVAARTAGTPEQQDALEDYLLQITGTPARARFRTYYGI